MKKSPVNIDAIKNAALTFRAIKHPSRQSLLKTIEAEGEISVFDLYKKLRITQANCSLHLGVLRRARFVNVRQEGKKHFYSVNSKHLALVNELAEKISLK